MAPFYTMHTENLCKSDRVVFIWENEFVKMRKSEYFCGPNN